MAKNRADIFIGNQAYGRSTNSGAIDLGQAGPRHFAADITNVAGNTPYVSRDVRCALLSIPRFFNYLPNAKQMSRALRQMIELSAQRIGGLNSTITPETAKVRYGNSGEEITVFTNISREQSAPEFEWPELQGFSYSRFWEYYYRMGVADEASKVPGVVALPNSPLKASDYDATFWAFDVLFWEPDPLMLEPTKAWLCTTMAPTSPVTVEGSMELNRIGEIATVSQTFSAVTEVGMGVMAMARDEMAKMKRQGLLTTELKTLHNGITEDVRAIDYGLMKDLEVAAGNRIK